MTAETQLRALRSASRLLGRELTFLHEFTGGQHATTLLATDGESEFVVRRFPSGHDAAVRETEVLGRLSELGDWVPHLVAARPELADPVIVATVVPGSAPDPTFPLPTIAREMAAALVRIHSLNGSGLPLTPEFPPEGDSDLAHRVRASFDELDMSELVLTHSDFWCGNALWDGERLTGVVDWSGAKFGPRGIDLAWCRQDLVLLGSHDAAQILLDEYERLLGREIPDIHDWDLHAAARACDRVETWLPNYLGIGRTDLTAETLRGRLDEWNATL